MNYYYVADMYVDSIDFRGGAGGAELSDFATIDLIGKITGIKFKKLRSYELLTIDKNGFYILSNCKGMHPMIKDRMSAYGNYITIQHDYQFIASRNPWLRIDEPIENPSLYKNSKANFFQTDFHLDMWKETGIAGNGISLKTTTYSDDEFDMFDSIIIGRKGNINGKTAIIDNPAPGKGRKKAIDYCDNMMLPYDLIPLTNDRYLFLSNLSKYANLVFFPLTPESCCRLVTEAKIMGLNVFTTLNYGATMSDWYSLNGIELLNKLKDIRDNYSIPEIIKYVSR